ncbi:hypothetical protein M406DRAFT_295606 [Cryphonectria parasitica EP155]|uniref:GDS1 winged helix domain-containing protein n=1 Tax=Cryphonectria parasitica (strain ATCC 38755 / EP155) TaxID=660469 RepID=A0A9P5CL60_CRYP1|nr:uncharacterized protein M406DRAFT_295606 [Cryphonectria parasitica EP155]KAF3761897.1 hypothetical protein M406DRAFT_295606 [Cryphonectria parasitica EP155]
MPYNTRRKSLSLPSLGIHVPVSNAARAAAAAIANRHSPSASSAASDAPAQASSRKIKRSHASSHAAATEGDHSAAPAPKRRQTDANTPPPSPKHRTRAVSEAMHDSDDEAVCEAGIDLATIDDDIVRAVIAQLQATRNRPHIVRDLAAILMKQVKIVQQSANPCAIISSRLSGYLKRSGWSAKNPCPLAKELENVHPRRTYFYLTTVPHQPLPDPVLSVSKAPRELPTPSASSGSDPDDDERRRELSPSPEVDLSAPELDDMDDDIPMPGTPIGSYSGRHSVLTLAAQVQRGAEPPLEKDEKEFTQTADGLQRRKLSGEFLNGRAELAAVPTLDAADDHAKYETLFGERAAAPAVAAAPTSLAPATTVLGSLLASPAIRPFYSVDIKKEDKSDGVWPSLDGFLDIRNPETVSLAELNEMLCDY